MRAFDVVWVLDDRQGLVEDILPSFGDSMKQPTNDRRVFSKPVAKTNDGVYSFHCCLMKLLEGTRERKRKKTLFSSLQRDRTSGIEFYIIGNIFK